MLEPQNLLIQECSACLLDEPWTTLEIVTKCGILKPKAWVDETRDVIWLNCMFYEKPVKTPEVIAISSEVVKEHGIKAWEGDGDAKADTDAENAAGPGQQITEESAEENATFDIDDEVPITPNNAS